ncbi:hypothetical protein [Campylobacter sp.]|uniref:hypothetical protein n=1 Tax=Campylobacter sp. TaxID=205 RepID=UPI002AA8AE06|nr:hypothetical protein [Campylobacter sp.]
MGILDFFLGILEFFFSSLLEILEFSVGILEFPKPCVIPRLDRGISIWNSRILK